MKKRYIILSCTIVFFLSLNIQAQQPIQFVTGTFVPKNNIANKNFKNADIASSLFANSYYLVVQFSNLPSKADKEFLKNSGIQLGNYIPNNAYLATCKSDVDFSTLGKFNLVSVNTIPKEYKIDKNIASSSNKKEDFTLLAIEYFAGINKTTVKDELQKLGANIVTTKFDNADVVFIQFNKSLIDAIASLPFVSYIHLQSIIDKPLNYNNKATHGFNALSSSVGRNLLGKGVTVGIGDNAEISGHTDFSARLINRVFAPPAIHGTHTSGTVGGGGIINPKNMGMAPKATLISQWFSDVITNTPTYITDYNMVATNNSYTASALGCAGNGVYDALSNYADVQMKNYENVLHVFAAGNDGGFTCSPFPASYGTIKSGWHCAKNVISVGSMNQATYTISPSSSRGPVKDGRIKPEIVANGINTISTITGNGYGGNSGTSMAAPVVAGASTLLNERYRTLNGGANPKAALIKALLCNTAEDLGNAGPDYTFGFGMLNARRAVEALEGNKYFINAGTGATYTITLPTGVRRLKVMLYWADAAAAPNALTTLVNDFDLSVTDPFAVNSLPLILNPLNVTATALQGADHINNIEQVVIENPAAGLYSLNVSAFNIPQGPQEYIITYQLDMNGVTVEYPFGGETLVPGEIETIRWNAFGDDANTFSIDTSFNNGATWGTLNNAVPATSRSLNWVVPTNVTNTALVRVSRNGSSYTDQSDFTFSISGQTVVTTTVPCEGYTQLNWAAIPSATSYDILQLMGDTMTVVGNTTSLSYLVSGLNANTSYWFGVAAKNSTLSGRRSISKNVTPATGTCTLADFDNNFKAVSIDAPITGRQFTTGALTATETIKFTIKNLDDVSSSGNYNLYYQINGNAPVMETVAISLNSLATYQYSFVQTADFSVTGIYSIKAWIKYPGDVQVLDDTVATSLKNLANAPIILPNTEGFETALVNDYTSNTIGLNGVDRADFKTNASRGRLRTFVNTGFALNGNRAITMDQFPAGALVTDSLLLTYNAINYNSVNQLRLDFSYKNHGQANNPNNKVWIRGSDNDNWIEAYDLVANQAGIGEWKKAIINVNEFLSSAAPIQNVSSSFQVKFGQQGNTSANNPNPILDQDDGYTFDDVVLSEAFNDLSMSAVLSPSPSGCNSAGAQIVSLNIKNTSSTVLTNVPVSYSINGGTAVTETMASIAANTTQTFTFATAANLTNNTGYDFSFWVKAPTDNYASNDSIKKYIFHTSSIINTFPYLEGFETDNGNWFTKGTNTSWAWGSPTKTNINKAANGSKAWATSLTANYNDKELSYLYSPCFDLSTLTQPVLSFSHIFALEDDCPCDYTWVEYSTNGGVTWLKLGTNGSGVNWYNDPTSLHQWRTSFPKWHVASLNVPTTSNVVRFRFVLSSDDGVSAEGVGIDDIHVFDKASIYANTINASSTQTVNGSNWVHFTNGSTRTASINANGQNLGNTTVDVYPFVGTVRTNNNQYYLNRNLVVSPTTQPTTDVTVRLYFTDAEAKSLIAATGCGSCSKPGDPYELGVTKYSGNSAQENSTLDDNIGLVNQFILPINTEIIPYDNGYYAEITVNSFSEFWFNNGGINANQPLPLNLLSFDAIKQNKTSLLNWKSTNEVDLQKYIIERSNDGINFISIGEKAALNTAGTHTYSFVDAAPLPANNFYRLKCIDKNGQVKYSLIRKVNFSLAVEDISVYPNPVVNGTLYVSSPDYCLSELLYDAAGKLIKSFAVQGNNISLNLDGVSKGIYQLKIVTNNITYVKKIAVQ